MSAPLGWLFLLVSVLNSLDESHGQYEPPTPTIEPLYPKGIRISTPHEDGITLVAFHAKVNDDFYSLEAGTISVDVIKPKNGRWVYQDRSTKLKIGDIVYLWQHVVYNGLGYNLLDQHHEVKEFFNPDGTVVGPTPGGGSTCTTTSETKIYSRDRESQQLRRNNACAGQVIFEENFDTLDTNRWKVIERFSTAPNFEFVVYKNNQDNVYVEDGNLRIKPTLVKEKHGLTFVQDGSLQLDKCTEEVGSRDCTRTASAWNILPPVISGRLNTKPSFNFMYGKVQVRAKLPRGDWIYPLITLETDDSSPNSTTFCSFVIAHSFGNPTLITDDMKDISNHLLQGGAYVTNVEKNNLQDNRIDLPSKSSDTLWSDDYHVYELEWRRERLNLKVDGEQYGEQRVPALFDTPAYVNVGLGVAGHSFFPNGCRSGNYLKPWKNAGVKALYEFYSKDNLWLDTWRQNYNTLSIDYIKVQAL
ncbi:beta-1,3-glucan-binding protein 1-like [Lasioglossum baleicum]|uniref:beta-1,3-glucan-binding protein 1-like n=1 Tax=Lasioglossum baleicum TaxID=434251 RepID=UPI003FCC6CF5